VDPRARLEYLEKRKFLTLPGLELRSLGRPAHEAVVTYFKVQNSEGIFLEQIRKITKNLCQASRRPAAIRTGHFQVTSYIRHCLRQPSGFIGRSKMCGVKIPRFCIGFRVSVQNCFSLTTVRQFMV
jgi:hypothetical protein